MGSRHHSHRHHAPHHHPHHHHPHHHHPHHQGPPHQPPPDHTSSIRIIHYNDVYNISDSKSEPLGGAARFITLVNQLRESAPGETIVTFAGDAFSPAPLTPFTKGKEMPPVMNAAKTDVACIGNHELDNGMDVTLERFSECQFPWVMSNLDEISTGKPIAGAKRNTIVERDGVKIGFFGLASPDWVETLSTVKPKDLNFGDIIEFADKESAALREQGCHVIVALVHLLQKFDRLLAETAKDVDIVLGGHDHIVWKQQINGRWAIKAGTDFKTLACIDITVSNNKSDVTIAEPVIHKITSEIAKDPEMEKYVEEQTEPLRNPELEKTLAYVKTTLDGRFLSVRTQETGLGNLVCDSIANIAETPNAVYNSGSVRADNVDPPSPWTLGELGAVLPYNNAIVAVKYTKDELVDILENAVSVYPELGGRFLQVSKGMHFEFDPNKPPGSRVTRSSIRVRNKNNEVVAVDDESEYVFAINEYMSGGADGFKPTPDEDVITKYSMTGPEMVAACMAKIGTDEDGDGELEPAIVSPKQEGRIVNLSPDPSLVEQYPY